MQVPPILATTGANVWKLAVGGGYTLWTLWTFQNYSTVHMRGGTSQPHLTNTINPKPRARRYFDTLLPLSYFGAEQGWFQAGTLL